jgi:ubiquitin-like protein ATG12
MSSTTDVPHASTLEVTSQNSQKSETLPVEKVKVHFVPVGSVPILKKTKFQIAANQRFASVYSFLRKVLKLQPGDSLFLYLQSAFCPGPEELLGDLNACFSLQQRGELVIHYSFQQAWG